jgi:hypothetical protein
MMQRAAARSTSPSRAPLRSSWLAIHDANQEIDNVPVPTGKDLCSCVSIPERLNEARIQQAPRAPMMPPVTGSRPNMEHQKLPAVNGGS